MARASIPEFAGKRKEDPVLFLLQAEAILQETGIHVARWVTVLAPQLKAQALIWWATVSRMDANAISSLLLTTDETKSDTMSSSSKQTVVEDIVSVFKTTQNQSWSMFNDKLNNVSNKNSKNKDPAKSKSKITLSSDDIYVFGLVPRLDKVTGSSELLKLDRIEKIKPKVTMDFPSYMNGGEAKAFLARKGLRKKFPVLNKCFQIVVFTMVQRHIIPVRNNCFSKHKRPMKQIFCGTKIFHKSMITTLEQMFCGTNVPWNKNLP
ncbi:hypothetical protein QTP88_023937 [Uroleucon formosanum]